MCSSRRLHHDEIATDSTTAVEGWKQLRASAPSEIQTDVLQAERARRVYRLLGAADNGSNVVAKRSKLEGARHEQRIYQTILPKLPGRHLKFYGFLQDGTHAWIYIEEAIGREYDSTNQTDLELAGEWLAILHTRSYESHACLLPPCGTSRYYNDLQRSKILLGDSAANGNFNAIFKNVMYSILSNLQTIETHWGELEQWCEKAPQALTHGDFKEENIRVGTSEARSILAFDWHLSGWGAPALDQAKFLGYSINPDITAYCETARKSLPSINAEQVYHLGFIGEAFRCIASIRWEAERMHYGWLPKARANLELYQSWLTDIVKARPWQRHAPDGARHITPRSWV